MADTSVPQPIFGPNGFVAPPEADILTGVRADIDAAFGGGLNPGLTTPQGQLASSQTAITGDNYSVFTWFCNQVDPAYSSGRMQDGIARIYFIQRFPARSTVVTCTCTGLEGTVIPIGALARSTDGNLYVATEQKRIPNSGNVDVTFACAVPGPISCAAGSLNTIYQTIFGWDAITNDADGVLGRKVESRSEFEERRSQSTGLNSMGPLGAILGGVLEIEGVLDAFVVENFEKTSTVVGGVLIGPNSLYVCALGGNADEIGFAVWQRKMPGCGYNGNTAVIVADPNPHYSPPPPAYEVRFQRPTAVDFAVLVTMSYNATIPDDALDQIQTAIINAFAGADGGPRAKIGSTIYASRYYAPVMDLGTWAQQIISIQVGFSEDACFFTGSITGSEMTVTGVFQGSLQVGDLIQSDIEVVETGTVITAFLTGAGGVGTYSVSGTQTVVSGVLNSTRMLDDVTVNANQAPAVATENIHLAIR